MATFPMKIRPFDVPDCVFLEMPPGRREDGMRPLQSIPVSELSDEALNEMCDAWRKAVFANAREGQRAGEVQEHFRKPRFV